MKSNWKDGGLSKWESWAHGALALAVSALMVGAIAGEAFRERAVSANQTSQAKAAEPSSVSVAQGSGQMENQAAR